MLLTLSFCTTFDIKQQEEPYFKEKVHGKGIEIHTQS